jgi:hypothetical protein
MIESDEDMTGKHFYLHLNTAIQLTMISMLDNVRNHFVYCKLELADGFFIEKPI